VGPVGLLCWAEPVAERVASDLIFSIVLSFNDGFTKPVRFVFFFYGLLSEYFVCVREFFSTPLNQGVKVAFIKIIENPILVGLCLAGPFYFLIYWYNLEVTLNAFVR